MLFKDLSLIEPLLSALETEGYEIPTPIQEQAIPIVLDRHDLLGCAQTGTGKTAAFALPILQILHQMRQAQQAQRGPRPISTLILTPTRELAIQIGESFTAYGRNTQVKNQVIFGGVSQHAQTEILKRGITDVMIATPGRLLDLMQQGYISLKEIKIFVLDEADRMLDMGFIHDVKKVIAKLPTQRQTLFFSATMPDEIADLANSILSNPLTVEVTPVSSTAENVSQAIYFVEKNNKRHLLAELLQGQTIKSALVFTRTKHGANRVAGDLVKVGVKAEAIHGNKSQNARQAALHNFKTGRSRVLVATDIAARGIDIDDLSHVVNFDLPNIPETYVHRIGRTGRAGASGIAISFCEAEELPYLKDIQKLTGQLVPVVRDHTYEAGYKAPELTQPLPKKEKGAASRPQPQPAKRPAPVQEKRPEGIELPIPPQRQPRERDQRQPSKPSGQQPPKPQQRQPERRFNSESSAQENSRPTQQQRPQQGQQRPTPQSQDQQRPNQRPAQQQRPEKIVQPSRVETPASLAPKSRFSSILEVSSIEKQDRPQKPKPDYRDRERTKERDTEPKTKSRFGGGGFGKGRR